jgi:hypothetical protein
VLHVIYDSNTLAGVEPRGILMDSIDAQAHSVHFEGRKAHGTRATPTAVVSGDYLCGLVAGAYDGFGYVLPGAISWVVAGSVSSNKVPTRAYILTEDASGVIAERFHVGPNGSVSMTDGYQGPIFSGTAKALTLSGTGVVGFEQQGSMSGVDSVYAGLRIYNGNTNTAGIFVRRSGSDEAGQMDFYTQPIGGGLSRRMIIEAGGNVDVLQSVVVSSTLTATNGQIFPQLQFLPTNSVPPSNIAGGVTNWIQCNVSNYAIGTFFATNSSGAAGSFLKSVFGTVSAFP